MRAKSRCTWTYINDNYRNISKVSKDDVNSKQNSQETQNAKWEKTIFLKQQVKNAALDKSALDKIMTTHELY